MNAVKSMGAALMILYAVTAAAAPPSQFLSPPCRMEARPRVGFTVPPEWKLEKIFIFSTSPGGKKLVGLASGSNPAELIPWWGEHSVEIYFMPDTALPSSEGRPQVRMPEISMTLGVDYVPLMRASVKWFHCPQKPFVTVHGAHGTVMQKHVIDNYQSSVTLLLPAQIKGMKPLLFSVAVVYPIGTAKQMAPYIQRILKSVVIILPKKPSQSEK